MPNSKIKGSLEISVLGDEFKICRNLKYLPLTTYPSYIQTGLIVFCLKGNANINIYGNEHLLCENELAVFFPGQLVSFTNFSDDFITLTFILSSSFYEDVLSGVHRFSPHYFFYMRSHFWFSLNEREVAGFNMYFDLISNRIRQRQGPYRREALIHLLRFFYLDLYNTYLNDSLLMGGHKPDARKEELADQFFKLIMEHYKENREVAFYADKLFITSKYLSMIIKEVSGKTAKDWITEYIVLEIKALLKNSTMNIQQIAIKTNFANQSSLGRFFRKHTGMSLLEYRMQK